MKPYSVPYLYTLYMHMHREAVLGPRSEARHRARPVGASVDFLEAQRLVTHGCRLCQIRLQVLLCTVADSATYGYRPRPVDPREAQRLVHWGARVRECVRAGAPCPERPGAAARTRHSAHTTAVRRSGATVQTPQRCGAVVQQCKRRSGAARWCNSANGAAVQTAQRCNSANGAAVQTAQWCNSANGAAVRASLP